MSIVLKSLMAVAITEIVIRMPFQRIVVNQGRCMAQAIAIIRNPRVSDHWKERALPAYSLGLLKASGSLAALLLVVAGLAIGLIGLINAVRPGFWGEAVSLEGSAIILGSATGYAALRSYVQKRL